MKLGIACSIRSTEPVKVARVIRDRRSTPVAAEFIRARKAKRARMVIPCDPTPTVQP